MDKQHGYMYQQTIRARRKERRKLTDLAERLRDGFDLLNQIIIDDDHNERIFSNVNPDMEEDISGR